MTWTASRRSAAALVAILFTAGLAEAREPTADEVAQWKQWQQLSAWLDEQLGDYVTAVARESDVGPIADLEDYTAAADALHELVAQRSTQVNQAVAALEAKFGTDQPAMAKTFFAEYGQEIVPGAPGFSRRLSDDRTRWLSTADYWPFLYYADLKQQQAVLGGAWAALTVKNTLERGRATLAKYTEREAEWTQVQEGADHVGDVAWLLRRVEAAVTYNGDDEALQALLTEVRAKNEATLERGIELVDAYEQREDIEELTGEVSVDEAREGMLELLEERGVEGVLSVRVTGDWEIDEKNILGMPTQYSIRAHVYRLMSAEHKAHAPDGTWVRTLDRLGIDDMSEVAWEVPTTFYTAEVANVKPAPPLRGYSENWGVLMRPGNVSGDGGGLLVGLLKLVFGLSCCFVFVAAVGGGGYFAYTQMQTQKALATVPGAPAEDGAPPASVPHAPPGAPGEPVVPPAGPTGVQPPNPPGSPPPAPPAEPGPTPPPPPAQG